MADPKKYLDLTGLNYLVSKMKQIFIPQNQKGEAAGVAEDLHAIEVSKLVQTHSNTLNTPYKEGLTAAAHGVCLVSVTGNYKTLLYIATSSTRYVYFQSCNNGVWSPWVMVSHAAAFKDNKIYVSPTGNDTTGNGTSEAPYASLAKALSVIPKNLGGQTITINIAPGTYAEAGPDIAGFFGGTLEIAGDSTTPPVFNNRISCDNCSCRLSFKYITVYAESTWAGLSFSRCSNVEINNCKVIAATDGQGYGIYSAFLSTVYAQNCEINNCLSAVMCAWGEMYISALTGTGNRYAASASLGGQIGIGTSVPGYTIAQYQTATGGRIYRDAQINVPKY